MIHGIFLSCCFLKIPFGAERQRQRMVWHAAKMEANEESVVILELMRNGGNVSTERWDGIKSMKGGILWRNGCYLWTEACVAVKLGVEGDRSSFTDAQIIQKVWGGFPSICWSAPPPHMCFVLSYFLVQFFKSNSSTSAPPTYQNPNKRSEVGVFLFCGWLKMSCFYGVPRKRKIELLNSAWIMLIDNERKWNW